MEFIKDNYLLIIIVGLFLIFALIGYLIDMLRYNNKEEIKDNIPSEVKPIELKKDLDENININEEKKETNTEDDLLKNYDENN